MQYLVVGEKGESSWGAHVPDLPGCVAVGESRDEVVVLIKEAIDLHIENLRHNGEPVPPASSEVELVETDAA
jgi:predicted RNase H-like HicB family nuclease